MKNINEYIDKTIKDLEEKKKWNRDFILDIIFKRISKEKIHNDSSVVRAYSNTTRRTVEETNDEFLVESFMKDKDFYIEKLKEHGIETNIIIQPMMECKSSTKANMMLKLSRWIERNVEHKKLNINETIIEFSILK